MTEFKPGDQVRITAKGRKVAAWRGDRSLEAEGKVEMVHGEGRSQQVCVAETWWPASSWEKVV